MTLGAQLVSAMDMSRLGNPLPVLLLFSLLLYQFGPHWDALRTTEALVYLDMFVFPHLQTQRRKGQSSRLL